jgi:hypothetical protein
LHESERLLQDSVPEIDRDRIRHLYHFTLRLFNGRIPGYRACNTPYHDLHHTMEVFLAMVRLVHGAAVSDRITGPGNLVAGLTAALMHDTGYLQEVKEPPGSGARHKALHEQRSMDFMARHRDELGLLEAETAAGQSIIQCTQITVEIGEIAFPDPRVAYLGKLLAAADLLAQLSDTVYLEKLAFLYREDVAAGEMQFENETNAIRTALPFHDFFHRRMEALDCDVDGLLRAHFRTRWLIDANLYFEGIKRHRDYLAAVLDSGNDPRAHLRRWGTVEEIREIYRLS